MLIRPAPTDESGAPVDRYAQVTIELPPGLTSGAALDPSAADDSLGNDPFSGQLNLGNTFGAAIGSQAGESGTSDDPTAAYDLAQRAAQTQRGDRFDINNPPQRPRHHRPPAAARQTVTGEGEFP
ncbi:MAG: hypothetical protein R3C12_21240 [Planctomycetaceae bacterium]